ncbi:G-D-S-L family lipolytic protein [Flavobacterium sp.]|jgi:lysophospholipase L1-like esterase|uniref:G-D-S-L family lipolytic protein n=1 Tax=Flavobacterium sp. TaxID=239 RepID=UPI0037C15770
MKNKFILVAALAIGFAGCEPEFENEVNAAYTSGEADFTSYVAVGNSLTAGYMDGTVSRVGQTYSYPNLLAQQFALVGGGAFTQPSFAEDVNNLGGISGIPGFGTRLVIDASQSRPEPIAGTSTITLTPQAKAHNNMGVPGAKSFHLLAPGYGNVANLPNANPYFIRHATTPNSTVLADAMTKNPTFFTNWIGNNDVLSYALSGGIGVDQNAAGNTNPSTYGSNDITNATTFAAVYNFLINGGTNPLTGQTGQTGLTSNGAKGVVCTIPSVTSIPFFTTVKYNALPAEATATNAQAIGLYQFLAAVTGGRIAPLSTAAGTKNPVLIVDENLSDLGANISGAASGIPTLAPFATALGQLYGKARQATINDKIVLSASSIIGQVNPAATAPFNVNGVTFPLSDQWVLIPSELTAISNATSAYNASIVSIANAKNLAVADMNAIMNKLASLSGLQVAGNSIYFSYYFGQNPLNLLPPNNPNFVSPSGTEGEILFSLDGVHPNARGYAVIANEFIKTINAKYKSNLPLHNPTYFPGISILPTN